MTIELVPDTDPEAGSSTRMSGATYLSCVAESAARAKGYATGWAQGRQAALAAVRSYREMLARYAGMRLLEVWHSRVDAAAIIAIRTPPSTAHASPPDPPGRQTRRGQPRAGRSAVSL